MPTEILMPQLGESVVEGTVSRWLIGEGQPVRQDQPLLQITTDKVDTELPAPASGILLKILVPEGQTVAKGTVLGMIGTEDEGRRTKDEGSQPIYNLGFISPMVGRLAGELGIDLTRVVGTGAGGRITKQDVLAYAAASVSHESLATPEVPLPLAGSLVPGHSFAEAPQPTDDEILPLSPMRQAIARHMVLSKQTTPHATTVMEADMTLSSGHASGCGVSSSGRASGSPSRLSLCRLSSQGLRPFPRPTAVSATTHC